MAFQECSDCAGELGSPILCAACLNNRNEIEKMAAASGSWRAAHSREELIEIDLHDLVNDLHDVMNHLREDRLYWASDRLRVLIGRAARMRKPSINSSDMGSIPEIARSYTDPLRKK